ncbi:NAD(+) hydrolase sarm1 isoform X2 [Galleria mellonella]|uniref:ADP-ribosyl cyclase/cyclic ADP-ribose hydrolase n=1 Tax=Galleria mellonella TaxID=7137 RepID=A0ABM3N211_GALME|nr:NAD(+) hydrolase sarm1 isoform X2 [Galleria mellonella]
MRRQEPPPPQSTGRGKSLIAMRTNQQQQRRIHTKSLLPRSYSSPAPNNDPDIASSQTNPTKGYVSRSFSSPEPKYIDYRRNSDSFYRPKTHGSRGELDSDLENFEPFEECFIDIDADQDNILGTIKRSPEREEPKKVVTSLLPGSGLQRITMKPISSSTSQTLQSARDVMKKMQKEEKYRSINFKPMVLKMPARHTVHDQHEQSGIEELQSSPPLELEAAELERELDRAEQHLEREVAIATEESDADTIPEFNLDGNSLKHNGGTKDMAFVMENLKKGGLVSRQNQSLNTQVTSSSTQQMVSSTTSSSATTSQRVQSSSQRLQHMTSEMKANSMKSDLSELKSSISEMKNLSNSARNFGPRLRSSMENIVDQDELPDRHLPDIRDLSEMSDIGDMSDINELPADGPLVTFPESDTPPPISDKPSLLSASTASIGSNSTNELKYSTARVTSASSTRVVADGYSASRSAANSAKMRRLQHGNLQYAESSAAGASHRMLQAEGLTAEQKAAYLQEQRSLKAGEVTAQEANNMSASSSRLQTEAFSAEKKAMAKAQARQTVTSSGMYSHKEHIAHSNMTISSKNMSKISSQMTQLLNGTIKPGDEDLTNLNFEDLDKLNANSNQSEVELAIKKYSSRMNAFITSIKKNQIDMKSSSIHFDKLNEMLRRAWAVPTHGHELGYSLCNALRVSGGLDILMANCLEGNNPDLQFSSAKLLEQCLTTENRAHVVENGLEKVVNVACVCTRNSNSVDHARIGTGILEHLFKHSESTCSDVINLGGLDAILFECRKNDVDTLRHCATALANLSLYGGAENQEAMIKRKVPMWLFPLAFHNDDNIKYYACLAIAVLVANKEIEAAVLKSGTLDLVEPFVTSHNPSEFARSNLAHAHGQSKNWLQRLVPVLSSKREEARNLAAFHFCMEAGIKKQQGNTEIFREIGAIESLKKVASCPNAVASKYAAQALRLIGEEVPHKLSQQVPLWSIEDVREWVKQIGFSEYANNFYESRVDGDLLLQITEENLKEDIGLQNGIKRKRFTRELQQLKKMADYTSRDTGSLNDFLQTIGPEYTIYTYSMLNAGVDKESIRGLSDEQLENECRIVNSIHRLRILNAIKVYESSLPSKGEENMEKNLDVFVSYRRSNGSQLASLLKVHLQLRGFTVFIDVERLEAGKFDNNLLQSIRQAKHFLLVLTPNALDRCKDDTEQKDWVHREIVAALQSQCNIVPIIDNFEWPNAEELPEDMRAVCHFNGVRWIHDYQDACVEKLESFLRGKSNLANRLEGSLRGREVQTPGTAAIGRGPPNYQRMTSCESRGSDKTD